MREMEEFISGFCKRQNQTRMVLCEFEFAEDGDRKLLSSDCDYGKCEYSRDCRLMAEAACYIRAAHPAAG